MTNMPDLFDSSNQVIYTVFNTLKASWLELKLAKWFGKRVDLWDGKFHVTCYIRKGKYYFVSFKEERENTND